ncbi:hypothetical protein J4471_06040 [Candidatus Woesearchaeota archaeon]|nr:hypothetical protein [Candidatus Woesearchaeota archaeon]
MITDRTLEIIVKLDKPSSPEAQLKLLNLLKGTYEEAIRAYTHLLQISNINDTNVSELSLKMHLGTTTQGVNYSVAYITPEGQRMVKGFTKDEFYNLK